MKQKFVRISESIEDVLNEISEKTGMNHGEIIQRGILAVAVSSSVSVEDGNVESQRRFAKRWSPEDIEELRRLRSSGTPNEEIAQYFGRSYKSTMNKAYKIGV
jgi:hypothetical protein